MQQNNEEQRQLQKNNDNEKQNKSEEEVEHLHGEAYSEHEQDPYELDRNHFKKPPVYIVEMIYHEGKH